MARPRVSQQALEVLFVPTGKVWMSNFVVEALVANWTKSPTTPTGAGVSQLALEVLTSAPLNARVSSLCLEVLVADGLDPIGGGGSGGGGQTSFGYSV